MPDSKQADDVATYAAAVRSALASLPDAERASLLEDLENHLAEVASESDLSLQERLGKPEDYAAELRSAYGAGEAGKHDSAGSARQVVGAVESSIGNSGISRIARLAARAAPWLVGPARVPGRAGSRPSSSEMGPISGRYPTRSPAVGCSRSWPLWSQSSSRCGWAGAACRSIGAGEAQSWPSTSGLPFWRYPSS